MFASELACVCLCLTVGAVRTAASLVCGCGLGGCVTGLVKTGPYFEMYAAFFQIMKSCDFWFLAYVPATVMSVTQSCTCRLEVTDECIHCGQ